VQAPDWGQILVGLELSQQAEDYAADTVQAVLGAGGRIALAVQAVADEGRIALAVQAVADEGRIAPVVQAVADEGRIAPVVQAVADEGRIALVAQAVADEGHIAPVAQVVVDEGHIDPVGGVARFGLRRDDTEGMENWVAALWVLAVSLQQQVAQQSLVALHWLFQVLQQASPAEG
jgi:hypothetical protein